jgi:Leucine-rich repeat (LRR) protein
MAFRSLQFGGINHVHTLKFMNRQYLFSNDYVNNVSSFCNLHTLNLLYCRGISDVSALGGIHNLKLIYCQGVSDMSTLGNVHFKNAFLSRS